MNNFSNASLIYEINNNISVMHLAKTTDIN